MSSLLTLHLLCQNSPIFIITDKNVFIVLDLIPYFCMRLGILFGMPIIVDIKINTPFMSGVVILFLVLIELFASHVGVSLRV